MGERRDLDAIVRGGVCVGGGGSGPTTPLSLNSAGPASTPTQGKRPPGAHIRSSIKSRPLAIHSLETAAAMSAAYADEDDAPQGEQLAEDMNEETRMKYSKGTVLPPYNTLPEKQGGVPKKPPRKKQTNKQC